MINLSDLPVPFLMLVACSVLCGILLASLLALTATIYLLAMLLIFLLLILCWSSLEKRLLLLLMLGFLCGAWRYAQAAPANDPYNIARWIGPATVEIQGTVSNESGNDNNGRLLYVTVSEVRKNSNSPWSKADGEITMLTPGLTIEDPYGANDGDDVSISGKLQPPAPSSSITILASMLFPRVDVLQPASVSFAWLFHIRVILASSIERSLPQPEAALLVAILLSFHTTSLNTITAIFNVTDTAHMLAPSGFKITILAGVVMSLTGRFFPAQRSQAQLPAEKRGSWQVYCTTIITILSILLYALLSGAGPAAIRAGIMGTLLVIAPRLGRRYNVYTALAFAALLMSIYDPLVLWDSGFQLSFSGTSGIVVLTPYFQRLLHHTHLNQFLLGELLTEHCAVTLAAQTATLPIIATDFQHISFVALPANILTVPLLGLFVLGGFILCLLGLINLSVAQVAGWLIYPFLWYINWITGFWAGLPHAYLLVPHMEMPFSIAYYGSLFLLLFVLKKKRLPPHRSSPQKLPPHTWRILQLCVALTILTATGISTLATQFNHQLTLTFLAVGPAGKPAEGEAILLQTPDGKSMLIDGGSDARSLAQELDSHLPFWQRSLDLVLLTTPLSDHLNGLLDVIQRYSIGTVLDAGMFHPNTTYALWRRTIDEKQMRLVTVQQGEQFFLGKTVTIQILWPGSPLHKGSNELRDNALVLRIITPFMRVLFLGVSAGSGYALQGLLSSVDESYLRAEVVQLEGEGSTRFASALPALLAKTQATLLIETPAAGRSRQTAHQSLLPLPITESQIVQTQKTGSFEIAGSAHGITFSQPGGD